MIGCFSYTKLNIDVITFICSIIITLSGNIFYNSNKVNFEVKIGDYCQNTYTNISETKEEESLVLNQNIWRIEIPKINLVADIQDGTSNEVLNNYVGHFENTQRENGNIGLAAHNRGYNVNYFSRIKELEIGDQIIYTYNGKSKYYKINSKNIIKDTEWTFLENTKDNRLTLITCVENKPEYRRCIQAIEI